MAERDYHDYPVVQFYGYPWVCLTMGYYTQNVNMMNRTAVLHHIPSGKLT